MRPLLLLLCVSLSGCMHGCGGDSSDREEGTHRGAPNAGAEEGDPADETHDTEEDSEDYAEPPPIEPPD